MVLASMPICAATLSGVCAASDAPSRVASAGDRASRRATMTWAIASASRPSVPGAAAIHSSAESPVSDRRGPTYTYFAIELSAPAANAWARVNAFWNSTGESHVSMKSAPNETMYFAAAKS